MAAPLKPSVTLDVVYTHSRVVCGLAPRTMTGIVEGVLQLAIPRRSLGSSLFYLYFGSSTFRWSYLL